jgi:hypothetical protein
MPESFAEDAHTQRGGMVYSVVLLRLAESVMPLRSVIRKDYRLVVSTGEGRVTLDDVMGHQETLLRNPDFNPDFNQLVDVTSVSDVTLSGDDLRKAVGRKIFSPASRIAVVASGTFMYGMLRMTQNYQELSAIEQPPVSIFMDRASALKWLGVPEDAGLM